MLNGHKNDSEAFEQLVVWVYIWATTHFCIYFFFAHQIPQHVCGIEVRTESLGRWDFKIAFTVQPWEAVGEPLGMS